MGLRYRWSQLELCGLPYVGLSSFPRLRALKIYGIEPSYTVPALDASLLKTVRLEEWFPLQSVPSHITHLVLSTLHTEDLPTLLSFPNLVELHFSFKYFTQDDMPQGDSCLDLLTSQPSLCRLSIALVGDDHNAIYQKLSSPDFLPNLEHLTVTYLDVEFYVKAVKMIRS
ncbi:hypothetical protein EV421DRAFT_367742 [Armillaria borealis]|uniref:F-box domain-containing protein n=1 Tax=Armillaria borealis TaxID=47425 RepID=A0AA39MS94_9AGAR|nr:hypothetical protein EV421DRAFT_367742 [Armillaria borealis]